MQASVLRLWYLFLDVACRDVSCNFPMLKHQDYKYVTTVAQHGILILCLLTIARQTCSIYFSYFQLYLAIFWLFNFFLFRYFQLAFVSYSVFFRGFSYNWLFLSYFQLCIVFFSCLAFSATFGYMSAILNLYCEFLTNKSYSWRNEENSDMYKVSQS